MKFQKKNLLVLALAGVVSVLMVGGCTGGEETTTTTGSQPSLEEKDLTYTEIKAVPKANTYQNDDTAFITASTDKKFVYVVNGAKKAINIFSNDDKAIDTNIVKDAKWTKTTAAGQGTDATSAAVSQIDLNSPNADVKYIYPHAGGAVVTVDKSTAGNKQGIALFNGATRFHTWNTDPDTSIGAASGGATGAAGTLGIAGVMKNSTDADSIVAFRGATAGTGGFVALTAATVVRDGLGVTAARTVAAPVAFASNGDVGYVASGVVIDSIAKAEVKAGGSSFVAAVAPFAPAADTWNVVDGTNQTAITAMVMHGTNLYVGFAGAANTGGVLVIKGLGAGGVPAAVKPDPAGKGKTVRSFAVRPNGDVFAFADDTIFVFKGDASKPTATYTDTFVKDAKNKGITATDGTAKAGWLGDLSATMNSGAWLSDDVLLVGDSAGGLKTINFKSVKKMNVKK